jgi:MFS family permease
MIIVGGSLLAVSAVGFFRVPLLPAMGAELAMNPTALSLVTTLFAAGRLISDVPAGRLADVLPLSRLLAAASLAAAAGSALMAIAGGAFQVYLGAALLGAGSATANTTGMTFFSTATGPSRRGKSMAVYSSALLGGQSLGPAASGLLSSLGSWRIASAAGAATSVVVALALFVSRALASPSEDRGAHATAISAPSPRGPGSPGGRTRPGERAILNSVSFASFFALGSIPQTLVPFIGADAFGLSVRAIGLALGLGGVFRFAGSLAGGVASDRFSRKPVLVAGLAIMTAGIVLLAPRAGTALWLVAIALFSAGSFAIAVSATVLADRTHAAVLGRRFGTYRLAGDLGLMAGPVTAGFLYTRAGQPAAVLAVAALLGLCTLACAVFLTGQQRRATR